jgi:hypothetical protein
MPGFLPIRLSGPFTGMDGHKFSLEYKNVWFVLHVNLFQINFFV